MKYKKKDIEEVNLTACIIFYIFGSLLIIIGLCSMFTDDVTNGLILYSLGMLMIMHTNNIKLLKKNTGISLFEAIGIKMKGK